MSNLYKNITYSKMTESKLVSYCMNNLSLYNENIKKKYRKENTLDTVFRIIWLVLEITIAVCIGTAIRKLYPAFSIRDTAESLLLTILISLAVVYIMEQLKKYVVKKICPTKQQIDKETHFLECIKDRYIPLFELQEMLKKEEVEKLVINESKSILTIFKRLPNGIIKEKRIYLCEGCDAFMKDYMLDFAWIDKELNEQLEKVGLPTTSE